MTLPCILGMNDFIKGKEFEEGASEARRGWEGAGGRGGKRQGAVERRARLGLGHLPMMLPHPWREAPGTD